ncbi:hypothetical protein [Paenibacillus dendritiformis]|uniref:hypothetical protein n=1 Tax=Paenibacillus dendritiformis TaxID=130049 RepID=UPI001F5504FF|nr:hypothetical protein [Paenibacillus dendritiformis]
MRILIGSPVHQKPAILRLFLRSLENLDCPGAELHYAFIDDNSATESSDLLREFLNRQAAPAHSVIPGRQSQPYPRDDITHYWNDDLIWKAAAYKNQLISAARD